MSTSVRQSANYNIVSRSSHWNVFCKKGVLEISSKILKKYLWLSSNFVNELWAWLLLSFHLIFDSAKEASNDGTPFLKLRINLTIRKPALFWENITCEQAPSQEAFNEGRYLTFCRKKYLVELEKSLCDCENSLWF